MTRIVNSLWKVIPLRFQLALLQRVIRKKTGRRIFAGPFAGMKYTSSAGDGIYFPRMLGTYEKELDGIVEGLCRKSLEVVINVGAGEGYYAVGFATRLLAARIIAFEADPSRRNLIAELARMNGVADRVLVEGTCDLPMFSQCLSACRDNDNILIFMDVEGAEENLLALDAVPRLNSVHIVVETHDFVRGGISDAICARFCQTHKIQCLQAEKRTLDDFPVSILGNMRRFVSERCILAAMSERRPDGMKWLCLSPLSDISNWQ